MNGQADTDRVATWRTKVGGGWFVEHASKDAADAVVDDARRCCRQAKTAAKIKGRDPVDGSALPPPAPAGPRYLPQPPSRNAPRERTRGDTPSDIRCSRLASGRPPRAHRRRHTTPAVVASHHPNVDTDYPLPSIRVQLLQGHPHGAAREHTSLGTSAGSRLDDLARSAESPHEARKRPANSRVDERHSCTSTRRG
jgi:hypothetical protein